MFKRQAFNHYLITFFSFLFVILLDFLGFLELSRLRYLTGQWQALVYGQLQNILQPVTDLRHLWQLKQRLEDVQYRYQEALVQLSELEALRSENQALRALVENTDRQLQSNLIARPISSFAKPVVALKTTDQIQTGAMVLGQGSLLGVVNNSSYGQAEVLLLKDMLDQGIIVKTETGVKGLVKGDGQRILLTAVASDAELKLDQRVLTAGQIGIAPDILVGKIVSIEQLDPALASQEAIIEQLVNFYQLQLVEIRL